MLDLGVKRLRVFDLGTKDVRFDDKGKNIFLYKIHLFRRWKCEGKKPKKSFMWMNVFLGGCFKFQSKKKRFLV